MPEVHQSGEIIRSRYQITDILGEGGIGITYAANDLTNNQAIALKALSFRQVKDWKVLDLFEREAKVLSQLNHPAIASYLDYFQVDTEEDRRFYIVQELVEGRSLARAIAEGWHGNEADIRAIASQVLEILIYLHELKPPIIHRDIKPQNLIMQSDGKIILVDFGAVQDTYRDTQIGGSTVVGTYGYMPPEQYRGKAVPATDLYGLGATLLFLLTGRSPAELPEVKLKISFRKSVSISDHFANWLDRMIEPALEDRFSNARQALRSLQNEVIPEIRHSDADIHHLINSKSDRLREDFRYSTRPLGSRIEIRKSDEFLEIYIPPTGWNGDGISILLFALFWDGFLIVWTSLALKAGLFALFSIPFWIVGVGMTYVGLLTVYGKVNISINSRNFKINWDVLGIRRLVKGKTEDLRFAELKSSHEVNNQPITELCLYQGIYSHKFGSGLSRLEKDWLLQEINDFLRLWRSRS
ncbi:MAG: serine/threonine protein kinase [Pseudanabaena sp.]|nr:MAG: serine/threonine protein kinase [Pseudanabaena sp.]